MLSALTNVAEKTRKTVINKKAYTDELVL